MKNMLAKFIYECSSDMMLESVECVLEILDNNPIIKYSKVDDVEYVIFKHTDEHYKDNLMSYRNSLMSFTVIVWDVQGQEVMEIFKDIRRKAEEICKETNYQDEAINLLDEYMIMAYPNESISFGE